MGRTSLAFSQQGLNAAGFNADRIAHDLGEIRANANWRGELIWGALGLLGEPARTRHNRQRADFLEEVRRGVTSAEGIARNLAANARGYQKVTDANLALLADGSRTAADEYDRREPGAGLIPPDKDLSDDVLRGFDKDSFESVHFQDTKGWQAAVLGAVTAGTLFSLPSLDARAQGLGSASSWGIKMPEAEAARIAKISARADNYVKLGARTCVSGALTLMLWFSMITVDDESIDEALLAWRDEAVQLFDIFGTNAVDTGELLARVWSGDAMNAADKKIRDFITAGVQLADDALGRFYGLQEAVKQLNRVYDAMFYLVVAEVMIMAALAVFKVNPAAVYTLELVGRRLFMAMLTVRGLAAAVLAGLMYHNVGRDHGMPLADGIPADVRFPTFSA